MEIRYWDRRDQKECIEKVYGESFIRWIYENPVGMKVSSLLLTRPAFSRFYGTFQSLEPSRKKIAPFIQQYSIPMEDFEDKEYTTFNDFFIRKFRPGKRAFAPDPEILPAFAEARYFGWRSVASEQHFPVKGSHLSAEALLGGTRWGKSFEGGPLLLARLCPVDYHRFHFPDSGLILESYPLHGLYHSVNPVALAAKSDILCTNERHVTILKTENFGLLAYVEVGAMCVGRIVQTHSEKTFARGDEKGYFLFGGSTVIVLGEPGAWVPDADLLSRTESHQECLVRLGEPVAKRAKKW